jgi:hypothetical protein
MHLQNPLILSADNTHIYVVNKNADNYELIKILKPQNSNSFAPQYFKIDNLGFAPKHIAIVGGNLYMVDGDSLKVYSTSFTNNNLTALCAPIATGKSTTAYHIAAVGNEVRFYYAYIQLSFAYVEYLNITNPAAPVSSTERFFAKPNYTVSSITSNANNIYLSAGDSGGSARQIYLGSATLSPQSIETPNLTSLCFVPNSSHLVFLNGTGKFNFTSMEILFPYKKFTVDQIASNVFSTNECHSPNFVFARSPEEIYIIDEFKSSIDMYTIGFDGKLTFSNIVVASKGADNGYHLSPRAVEVIDEYRYVVADATGVKLVNTRFNTVTPICALLVDRILFDEWKHIYLIGEETVQNGIVVSKYKITKNIATGGDVIEYMGIVDGGISSIPLSVPPMPLNSLGVPITTDDIRDIPFIGAALEYAENENFNAQQTDNLLSSYRPMWSLCRETGKVFYVSTEGAERHIIRSYTIAGYYKILEKSPYDWTRHLYTDGAENLFMRLSVDTVLYNLPNALHPVEKICPAGTDMSIVSTQSYMFGTAGFCGTQNIADFDPSPAFSYAMVVLPSGVFYVKNTNLVPVNFQIAREDLGFIERAEHKYGVRVLVPNLPIYRYPSNTYPVDEADVIVGRLVRNFALNGNNVKTPGLEIIRKIHIESMLKDFYEIHITDTGAPPNPLSGTVYNPAVHKYVGYVDSSFVNDTYLGAGRTLFTPNARVQVRTNINDGQGIKVYTLPTGAAADESVGEYLKNNKKVKILGNYNKRAAYTQVQYLEYGVIIEGWVETRYIKPDGISSIQIVAIVVLSMSVLTLGVILYRFVHARKRADGGV